MIIRLIAAWLVVSGLLIAQAQAHGGVSVKDNKCIMKIGPYEMNFTGYQPDSSREQFCDDIPNTGRTIIVLDAEQSYTSSRNEGAVSNKDLRDMLLDFRVLRNVGQAKDEDNMDQNTEIYVAPKNYPSGTLNFEYAFNKPGNFIGLVSAKSAKGDVYVSRFPFAVGQSGNKDFVVLGIIGLLVVAAGGGYFYTQLKKKPA